MPVLNLQRLVAAICEEYPVLEYLIMALPIEDNSTALVRPESFRHHVYVTSC